MALRDLASVPYLPFLSLRPAEMRALQELPDRTKDHLLPLVHLRPWTTALQLQSALDRLNEAYGPRPTVIAVGAAEGSGSKPVHVDLARLRHKGSGYANWCDFIAKPGHEHFIPAVQLEAFDEVDQQVTCFYELGRGIVVVVPKAAYAALGAIATKIGLLTNGGVDTCFVLDEEYVANDPLERAVFVVNHCRNIRQSCPVASIAISGSSFPDNFKSVTAKLILERLLFDEVASKIGTWGMIYSDRGSARYERQKGGGGQPAPRIDYPLPYDWRFYRSDLDGFDGYAEQARMLLRAQPSVFDPALRIWGTLMIERTAGGDSSAIKTPARSTAVRINIHLQRQTFINDPASLYDTEDDWKGG
ncbi:hypothetical protein ASE95_10770 [Sphingomonas sp. Leaf231]|uniref:beta family protein n=1 Tax=Sphingomonas sp. Leaf231 TaxID=1736301 RepID=UPI0006FDD21D|nr:beta family protein [Sphingomonas sp. Leaf231]KQN93056.1 hypothetical protein ASE95_10770 [Sphingomonas sp. Leaf231]